MTENIKTSFKNELKESKANTKYNYHKYPRVQSRQSEPVKKDPTGHGAAQRDPKYRKSVRTGHDITESKIN